MKPCSLKPLVVSKILYPLCTPILDVAEAPVPEPPTIITVGAVTYPLPGFATLILVITPATIVTSPIVAAVVKPPPDKATVGGVVYPEPPEIISIEVTALDIVVIPRAV